MDEFLFDLANAIENLDAVPEDFKYLYVQGQDGFKVDPKHVKMAEAFNGLKTNLKKERDTKTAANNQAAQERNAAKAWKELAKKFGNADTPEKLEAFIVELNKKIEAGEKIDVEALKRDLLKAKDDAVAAKDQEVQTLLGALEKALVESVAVAELAKEKGAPGLLLPVIKGKTKIIKGEDGGYHVRVVNPDGSIVHDGNTGNPLSIAQLVGNLKKDADYGRAFDSAKPAGGNQQQQQQRNGGTPTGPAKEGDQRSPHEKMKAGMGAYFAKQAGG